MSLSLIITRIERGYDHNEANDNNKKIRTILTIHGLDRLDQV